MFNLVLTFITLVFLGVGGYAALHSDGGAFLLGLERQSDRSTLLRLVTEAQQIGAAQRFHVATRGMRAESPDELVSRRFLTSLPNPPSGTIGAWQFDGTREAVLVAFDPEEDGGAFASRVCELTPEVGGVAQLAVAGEIPTHADLSAAKAIFGCGSSADQASGNPSLTWFIHGF